MANQTSSKITLFPTPYVFHHKVKDHEKIKKQLLPKFIEEYKINKNNINYKWEQKSTSTVTTNYKAHGTHYYTEAQYNSIIWEPLDALYKTLFGDDAPFFTSDKFPLKSYIEMIWWNVYTKGSYAIAHNHGYGKISGVYLLELNEVNSTTFLTDDAHYFGQTSGRTAHTADYAEEGDVLLFPSSLLHFVNPAIKRRTTIAFNVFTDFN
jgi:hypothetical protein